MGKFFLLEMAVTFEPIARFGSYLAVSLDVTSYILDINFGNTDQYLWKIENLTLMPEILTCEIFGIVCKFFNMNGWHDGEVHHTQINLNRSILTPLVVTKSENMQYFHLSWPWPWPLEMTFKKFTVPAYVDLWSTCQIWLYLLENCGLYRVNKKRTKNVTNGISHYKA